jgi:alpha-beta hydrolase superfamily lysophospholipase
MKLKLAQRIAIGYYETKFKLLSLFSKRKAAEAVFELFCTPYSGKPKRQAPAIFEKATTFNFSIEGLQLHGWQWKPAHPNGRKILIVHGFDSCSYRFERYIVPFLNEGFEIATFDAPGHGLSDGKRINALAYSHAILKAEELYGSFYGIMAHSLGGLSASLAFEQLPAQEGRKLVLIAPTTETTTAVENFFRFVSIPRNVQPIFHELLEEAGKRPVTHFSTARAVQHIHAPVLWIHDEDDLICPYSDTLPVQEMKMPHVEFFITKGLGHSGIYRHETVFKKILQFFGS